MVRTTSDFALIEAATSGFDFNKTDAASLFSDIFDEVIIGGNTDALYDRYLAAMYRLSDPDDLKWIKWFIDTTIGPTSKSAAFSGTSMFAVESEGDGSVGGFSSLVSKVKNVDWKGLDTRVVQVLTLISSIVRLVKQVRGVIYGTKQLNGLVKGLGKIENGAMDMDRSFRRRFNFGDEVDTMGFDESAHLHEGINWKMVGSIIKAIIGLIALIVQLKRIIETTKEFAEIFRPKVAEMEKDAKNLQVDAQTIDIEGVPV